MNIVIIKNNKIVQSNPCTEENKQTVISQIELDMQNSNIVDYSLLELSDQDLEHRLTIQQ